MAASGQGRKQQYFIPGDGIAREVIQADICKYLDNDASAKPGNYNGRDGYFIYAYRNLTNEMVADLRSDSAKWLGEKEEKTRLNRSDPSSSKTSGGGGEAQQSYSEPRYTESDTYELSGHRIRAKQNEAIENPELTRGPPSSPVTSSDLASLSSQYAPYKTLDEHHRRLLSEERIGDSLIDTLHMARVEESSQRPIYTMRRKRVHAASNKSSKMTYSSSERPSSSAMPPSRALSTAPLAGPGTLRETILAGNLDLAADLIDGNLSAVAQGKYEWLTELTEMGYNAREIANVLYEDETIAPWIPFETVKRPSTILDPDHHLHDCVHLQHLSTSSDIKEHADKINPSALAQLELDHGKRLIEEYIGLGGVVPSPKDGTGWKESVIFDLTNRSIAASVTYSSDASGKWYETSQMNSLEKLDHLISVCGRLQGIRLFCNSFTILAFRNSSVIEMVSIKMSVLLDFRAHLAASLDSPNYAVDSPVFILSISKLRRSLMHILDLFGFPDAKPSVHNDLLRTIVHCSSLATQALCIGLLSYASGHAGLLQTAFLDRPVEEIDLLGHMKGKEEAVGTLELYKLTCTSGLTKGEVRVFKSTSMPIPHQDRFDLLASPEDLIDTWGPGQFIQLKVPNAPERHLVAIEVGGGCVYRPPLSSKLHYEAGRLKLDESLEHFEAARKYILGASWQNPCCPKDESDCFASSRCALHILGTRAEYYELKERHIQFQGGQYIAAQFGTSWLKHSAITLKDLMLDRGLNLSLGWFLFSPLGMQISMCTGVAKRVNLAKLLSEVMVTFVNRFHSVSRNWEELLRTHSIIQVLSTTGTGAMFDSWLQSLPDNLQTLTTLLIRAVLQILRRTGYDSALQELVVAWPRGDNPFWCLRIPCNRANFWARILEDSQHCATFACITPECLETNIHHCCGRQKGPWLKGMASLDTEVCYHQLHQDDPAQEDVNIFKPGTDYFIGKPGSNLRAKLQVPADPAERHLVISKGKIPESIQRRLHRTLRLREKQTMEQPAEAVVILANSYKSSNVGFTTWSAA